MRLRELQAAFTGYVAGTSAAGTILPFVRDHGPASAAERLALHAGTLRTRAAERLSRGFPNTARLLGRERLASATAAHLAHMEAAPPPRPDLLRTWPGLLRTFVPLADRLDLGDLATLELARSDVTDAADSATADIGALAALAPEVLAQARLRFVPAIEVVRCAFDVSEVWEAVEAGLAAPPPRAAVTEVLVWRSVPGVFHSVLGAAEARALRAAKDGAPLSEVCAAFLGEACPGEAAHDALAGWFRDGLVAGLAPPETA